MPYIPKEDEERIITKYNLCRSELRAQEKPRRSAVEDIGDLLRGSIDEQFQAVEQLRKSNIRNYADEVRELVRNIKFYPEGRRGVDGVNAEAGFGLIPFQEYLVRANRENFLIVQIEDPEAVEHIEEIAAVDGVDVLFVGPADLSLNLGIAGQFCHPKMMEVYERVCNACRKYGKTAGLSCAFDKIPEFMEQGFRFFVGGADYLVIRNGYMNLREQLLKNGFTLRPVAAP